MNTIQRITKNTSVLGIAEVISRALQFVIMLYAARILTQSDFGKFSFALSISMIAVVLADLGINTYVIREVARKKSLAQKYFSNAISIKAILAIFAFITLLLFLKIVNYPVETISIVIIIWFFAILSTYTELFYSMYRAFEKMQYDALLKITRMVLLAISTLFVLFSGYGVATFCWMFVLVEILIIILAVFLIKKESIKIKVQFDSAFIKKLVKSSLPFGFSIIFGSIYFFIGTVILSKMKGDVDVAIFSAAYNIALALIFIPTVFTNAIYPVLSRYYKSSKQKLQTLYERSLKYLYIIGLPVSVGLYLTAEKVISLLYKNQYTASTIVLQIVAIYLIFKFINFLFGIVLSSIDQQNKRMLGQGITATLNIILNLLLIPIFGFVGAALATLITEVILIAIYYVFISNNWYYYNFLKIISKPLIAVIVMGLFVEYVQLHLLVLIPIAALIYFTSLFILKAFDKKDIHYLKSLTK